MIARKPFWGRLRRDVRGAAIVEFAFILTPLMLIILGGLEYGYQAYVRTAMQGALTDAARRAAVQNPSFTQTTGTLEDKIEATITDMVQTIAEDAEVVVTQKSFYEFSRVGTPEKLTSDRNTNGTYEAGVNDCFEDANFNGRFDLEGGRSGRGTGNDVVFYEATITADRLLPLDIVSGMPETFEFTLETAIRNQPYGTQSTPPILCGV